MNDDNRPPPSYENVHIVWRDFNERGNSIHREGLGRVTLISQNRIRIETDAGERKISRLSLVMLRYELISARYSPDGPNLLPNWWQGRNVNARA